jgi:UDP-N-acetylmuramate dehydrogenase
MEILKRVPLKQYAWWKIGGEAEYFCMPESVDDVKSAIGFARTQGLQITVLGGGTNVLISDAGVTGLVICTRQLTGVEVEERGDRLHITAMAGSAKSELTKIFMKRKLAPALFMCGLPGDVGGGVVMNAGVSEMIQPREFVEITDWVEVVSTPDGNLRRFPVSELEWKYRSSKGWQPGVVVRVGLSCPLTPDESVPGKVREATKNRLQRQPLDLPSCGSTFKNPPGNAAGALIERAGLKGYQVGGAQVSKKHANFIVNTSGHATAEEVMTVIRHVQAEVKRQFNIDLETEVRLLGTWPAPSKS